MTGKTDAPWLDRYFEAYCRSICQPAVYEDLVNATLVWAEAGRAGKKVLFAGNGGSAAMASHCSVDLTKTAGIRAINFNEADLITCLANDYGYEEWVSKAIAFYGDKGDVAVLISSSGRSANMLRAAETARELGMTVITLSGFDADNPLRRCGSINLWVDSHAYNVVEMTHHVWLLAIVDMAAEAATHAA